MDETEATEPTNQSETADDATASVEVPNIRDGARSGLDHEPLTPRKSTTLVGRGETPEVADPDGPLDQGGEQQAGGSGEPSEGTEVPADGTEAEVTGDGSGQALPPAEPQPGADEDGFGGDAPDPAAPVGEVHDADALAAAQTSEQTAPEGTPIGDAAEQDSADQASSDAGAPESPASDDNQQAPQG